VIRRVHNAWQGWTAVVHTCSVDVPIPVGDTASETTAASFRTRARRECGQERVDTLNAASVFSIDTLEIHEIGDATNLRREWDAAVKAGALALPPRVKRAWMMLDGFTYAVEVRRGLSYRASVIEQVDKPEVEADRQAQAVYRSVSPLLDTGIARRP